MGPAARTLPTWAARRTQAFVGSTSVYPARSRMEIVGQSRQARLVLITVRFFSHRQIVRFFSHRGVMT